MSGETIRVGILGAASIARKNVAAITKASGVEVVAVGSRSKSKAEKFIEENDLSGRAKAYGSYEEVLQSPEVDAVYLPLPTAIHLEWAKKAAQHKKHMILEKPIALSKRETDEILEACQDAGVQFMDGTMFVHNPRVEVLKPIICDENSFGKLTSVTSTFTWKAGADFLANDVRTKKDGDALGVYGDIGWYCIKAALWAYNFDKPVSVQAHPGVNFNSNGVVMHGGGSIVWKDGRRLTFDCGFDAVHSMYLQIAGEEGMIEVQDFCIPYRPEVSPYVLKGPGIWHDNDTWVEQKVEEHKVPLAKPQESYMWERFAACVRNIKAGGKPEQSWSEEARLCNKLCIAVEESAQNGGKLINLDGWL